MNKKTKQTLKKQIRFIMEFYNIRNWVFIVVVKRNGV
jgi:hypothetical protein